MSLVAGGLLFAASAQGTANAAATPTVPFDQCSKADLRDDPRLGPAKLPIFGTVANELDDYRRTGKHPIWQFLGTWWDPSLPPSAQFPGIDGNWVYPPKDGYYLRPDGTQIRATTTLVPGQQVDRFGLPRGSFLSPRGTDYAQRSLPPSNLDDTTNPGGCNYHVYQVLKPFDVYSGPIRPWFDQPGNGLQYQAVCVLIPEFAGTNKCDETGGNLRIQYLVDAHYVVEVPVVDRRILVAGS
ncbi:TNT domain-containing protein [Parafrankia sp. EUN1f]|uniref:TNT domain-containing protein n=1 Tax=Parafrankia sp. EUN1f TaxID=102897 RepID=UPI001E5B0951|nr:TNT domain-containing protein [Parafrankia sp. EUN1f]